MITIVDYRMNNLRSLENTLRRLGHETLVSCDPVDVMVADKLLLPGVGAFGDAMEHLNELGLSEAIIDRVDAGVPILGVCLGMQLLFDDSEEFGFHRGLGLLPGSVVRIPGGVHVPHMGWNQLHLRRADPLVEGVRKESFVYFVHSFAAAPEDPSIVIAETDYGSNFPSIVGSGKVWATQFHPEKSQHVGERILENFARL
ncbi:MAG TPA: imidazole glycerol phosphate synthase subunit HisH [Rhodothermales bacterium]|jgi:glutamine amidotransferase